MTTRDFDIDFADEPYWPYVDNDATRQWGRLLGELWDLRGTGISEELANSYRQQFQVLGPAIQESYREEGFDPDQAKELNQDSFEDAEARIESAKKTFYRPGD